MAPSPVPVRERTRLLVREQLTHLAQELFVERGYDATTIDDLAEAAGMSRRTFFRYFASKEELVVGKYEVLGEQLANDLAARPADEPLWTSMRAILDRVVTYFESDERSETTIAMEKIVRENPALNASYLERIARMQDVVVRTAAERAPSSEPSDPRLPSIVGAAFACLIATWSAWLACDRATPFGTLLDQAMGALHTR